MTNIRSASIKNADQELGVLWEAEPGHIVFVSDLEVPANVDEEIQSLVASANGLNLPDATAFKVVHDLVLEYVGEEPVVAAGAPGTIYETYTLYVEEDDTVVGLTYIDEDDNVFVRANGEWVEPNDEDWLWDHAVDFVSENAVQLFDTLVQDDNRPHLDDFNEVSLD